MKFWILRGFFGGLGGVGGYSFVVIVLGKRVCEGLHWGVSYFGCQVASLERSHLNGSIPFERTTEQ